MADSTRLENEALHVVVAARGAELQSLACRGQALLWNGDPAYWPRHAPVLFPIVGRLKNDILRVAGKEYTLSQHGFARDMTFALVDQAADHCIYRLTDSAGTRDCYPFSFQLDVGYQLQGSVLSVSYQVTNRGDTVMPFSIGAHPAFVWPLPGSAAKSAHIIEFEREETMPVRRLTQGLLRPESLETPVRGTQLVLDDSLFEDDALVFDRPASRRVAYSAADSAIRIDIGFDDFPQLGIWSKPGAGFVCIEPWRGHASPESFAGELSDKPGIVCLEAGGEMSLSYTIGVSST